MNTSIYFHLLIVYFIFLFNFYNNSFIFSITSTDKESGKSTINSIIKFPVVCSLVIPKLGIVFFDEDGKANDY
jgi:hypothetical protein